MTMKETQFFVWLLLVVALSFLLSHFLSCTLYLIQKAVAFGLIPLLVFSKLGSALAGIHFCS